MLSWERDLTVTKIIISVCLILVVSLAGAIVFMCHKLKKGRQDAERYVDEIKEQSARELALAMEKTNFVTNMSHEIRTPMNAICCATELLMKEELPVGAGTYCRILKSSSDNLLEMINDILDFSKINAGEMSIIEGEYSVRGFYEDVKNIIAIRLTDKPIAFTVDINPLLPKTLIGDEVRIKQILINLLGNAVKYTQRGEIRLSLDYERISKNAIDFKMSVGDTGCGITPTDKNKLVERFRGNGGSSYFHKEGSGLGLSICKMLTDMMGGRIDFDSELGKGSVFTAVVRQGIPEGIESPDFKDDDKTSSLEFVIWEDNVYERDGILRILASLGVPAREITLLPDLEALLSSVRIDYIISAENHFYETVAAINKFSPTTVAVKIEKLSGDKADSEANYPRLYKPVDLYQINNLLNSGEYFSKDNADFGGKLSTPDARILIVDDNRVNLKVAKALLETFTAKVTAVDSGYEAIELIKQGEKYDLIFMDHMMPGMDGIEAANRIWNIEGAERTNVIALTANTGSEIEKMFRDSGMCDFIPKPIVMKHLNYVLQKWLPKDKQIFISEEESDSIKIGKAEDAKILQPAWGLSQVWDDEKIYLEVLNVFLEKSKDPLRVIKEGKSLQERCNGVTELRTMATSVGAVMVPIVLTELVNIANAGDVEAFDNSVKKLASEYEQLTAEITKYIEAHRPEDILTFE